VFVQAVTLLKKLNNEVAIKQAADLKAGGEPYKRDILLLYCDQEIPAAAAAEEAFFIRHLDKKQQRIRCVLYNEGLKSALKVPVVKHSLMMCRFNCKWIRS
jgi:hypothetical protein